MRRSTEHCPEILSDLDDRDFTVEDVLAKVNGRKKRINSGARGSEAKVDCARC